MVLCGGHAAAADLGTAIAAYDRGDFATAFAELQELADGRDGEALLWLGYLYREGQGNAHDKGARRDAGMARRLTPPFSSSPGCGGSGRGLEPASTA